MITYNERFSFWRDGNNWILIETYNGHDKHGKPKSQTRESYFSRLSHLFNEIVDRTAGEAEDLEELGKKIQETKDKLVDILERWCPNER